MVRNNSVLLSRQRKMFNRRKKIILYVTDNPDTTCRQIAKALSEKYTLIRNDMKELRQAGLLPYKRKTDSPKQEEASLVNCLDEINRSADEVANLTGFSKSKVKSLRRVGLTKTADVLNTEKECAEETEFHRGQVANSRRTNIPNGYEGIRLPIDMWNRYIEIKKYKERGLDWEKATGR